jgi:hypothetical protein
LEGESPKIMTLLLPSRGVSVLVAIKNLLALQLFAMCLLPAVCASQSLSTHWVVMRPGSWQNADCGFEQCGTRQSELQWLALVPGTHRWTLEPITFRWDEAQGDLDAPIQGTIAFLHYPSIHAGPVATPDMKFKGQPRSIRLATASIPIAFAGMTYRVAVEDGQAVVRAGDSVTSIGRVDPGAHQTDDSFWVELLWAGDLDRDGRLDFLVTEHNAGLSEAVCLYLSSAPHPSGGLAAKVGCEVWGG